jgi:integrase/recombinase XerD
MSTQPAGSGLRLVEERPPGPGLTDFALWLRANGCSETTVEYRLNHVADFARHHPSFPNVNPMHVTGWLGREGYAPWSRRGYYGHLHSYFAFAVENDLLAVNPMAKMRRPKPGKCVPRPLSPQQVDAVLAAARPKVRAWLILGLYAGLRAHEIAKLRAEDVDVENIYVLGKGGQAAFVPTHPLVWALAADLQKRGWWFPTQYGPASSSGHVTSLSVSTQTANLFKRCGIEGSVHRARHTPTPRGFCGLA